MHYVAPTHIGSDPIHVRHVSASMHARYLVDMYLTCPK